MRITLTASSWARSRIPGEGLTLEVPAGTTALEAARFSGLPEDDIGLLTRDGVRIPYDAPLAEGDEIFVLPSIIGG